MAGDSSARFMRVQSDDFVKHYFRTARASASAKSVPPSFAMFHTFLEELRGLFQLSLT